MRKYINRRIIIPTIFIALLVGIIWGIVLVREAVKSPKCQTPSHEVTISSDTLEDSSVETLLVGIGFNTSEISKYESVTEETRCYSPGGGYVEYSRIESETLGAYLYDYIDLDNQNNTGVNKLTGFRICNMKDLGLPYTDQGKSIWDVDDNNLSPLCYNTNGIITIGRKDNTFYFVKNATY